MLGFIDRFLTLWIFLAIFAGLILGVIFPDIALFWNLFAYKEINVLLSLCLILMMYPPLAKVDYTKLSKVFDSKKIILLSMVLNWLVGPLLMFILAFIFLKDEPLYMQGVVIIGLARCIAMVVVWSDLAKGDMEYTSALVAMNSIFQIFFFSALAYVYLDFLPSLFDKNLATNLNINFSMISENVLIYLGIPFLMGFITRFLLLKYKNKQWYENTFLPKISPITLITLLLTIIIMCSLKGDKVFELPLEALKIAFVLVMYFVIMFFITWFISKKNKIPYSKTCSLCFSASGNNFELAIIVCIATFGLNSEQAFASIIGPLVEVPVLILLVKWALMKKEISRF
ncbi:ACR3 family arsenite efflux transporter [Campylobacter jejuni]|nr:ACR3 family arsenite efflux transporter [Campylobacter jejuni]